MTLNKNAQLWVEALESGRFKQGQGALQTECDNEDNRCEDMHYCCLGVACRLFIEQGGELEFDSVRLTYDQQEQVLPHKVQEWLGLRTADGDCSYGTLADMNDTGDSFTDIAALIRSEPKGLFQS